MENVAKVVGATSIEALWSLLMLNSQYTTRVTAAVFWVVLE